MKNQKGQYYFDILPEDIQKIFKDKVKKTRSLKHFNKMMKWKYSNLPMMILDPFDISKSKEGKDYWVGIAYRNYKTEKQES